MTNQLPRPEFQVLNSNAFLEVRDGLFTGLHNIDHELNDTELKLALIAAWEEKDNARKQDTRIRP